jgi:hypothetical protein
MYKMYKALALENHYFTAPLINCRFRWFHCVEERRKRGSRREVEAKEVEIQEERAVREEREKARVM